MKGETTVNGMKPTRGYLQRDWSNKPEGWGNPRNGRGYWRLSIIRNLDTRILRVGSRKSYKDYPPSRADKKFRQATIDRLKMQARKKRGGNRNRGSYDRA